MNHHTPTKRFRPRLAAAAVLALLAGACSAERPELGSGTSTADALAATQGGEPDTTDGIIEPGEVAPQPMRAISVVESLPVFWGPGNDIVLESFSSHTDFGSARVFLVEEISDDWVRIQLPVRPNGSSGWVRMVDVKLELIDTVVTVDLAARTLSTWVDGEMTSITSVAVGSEANPTPTGTFFITDKIDTTDDGGVYGPFALGLSAHSETLTEFAGGDGQIGIHGTNDPGSIGQAVSHGCVRLPNEVIEHLATELPLGTPVVIA